MARSIVNPNAVVTANPVNMRPQQLANIATTGNRIAIDLDQPRPLGDFVHWW